MIKDIIVGVDVGKESDFAVDFAISVAVQFGAHVTGVAFIYDPAKDTLFNPRFVQRFQEELQSEIEESASASIARFESATRQAGLSAIIQAALFESGRPILVVPYIQKEGLRLGRVIVCWDGSRAAARAIGDAMPFLVQSDAVDEVVVADEPTKSDEIPRPTEGVCNLPLFFHIERGSYGGVALDGLNVALAIHAPGPIAEGNWVVGPTSINAPTRNRSRRSAPYSPARLAGLLRPSPRSSPRISERKRCRSPIGLKARSGRGNGKP